MTRDRFIDEYTGKTITTDSRGSDVPCLPTSTEDTLLVVVELSEPGMYWFYAHASFDQVCLRLLTNKQGLFALYSLHQC
jgi:hypothetical protein